jgi:hypothetical protein
MRKDLHLKVTALSGFGTTIVVGTGHGCLVIFDASNTSLPNWQEEAKLMLSEARVRQQRY